MKKIYSPILSLFSILALSQVAIGKSDGLSSPSVSLEFGEGNRGLVLPWVTNKDDVNNVVNGTIVFDSFDKKVKVKYASGWKDLTIDETGTTVDEISGIDGLTIQTTKDENANAKVSIGVPKTPSVAGILVLEDDDKAMILPKMESPHLNIINPSPGMMAYDTVKKQLAIYNGSVWTFWEPE